MEGNENETYVRFYIKDQIKVMKSYLSYTEVSLLAEVGGYVGLFLGTSMNQIATATSYLLDRLEAARP